MRPSTATAGESLKKMAKEPSFDLCFGSDENEPPPKKARFASVSEEDLDCLDYMRVPKNTRVSIDKWIRVVNKMRSSIGTVRSVERAWHWYCHSRARRELGASGEPLDLAPSFSLLLSSFY